MSLAAWFLSAALATQESPASPSTPPSFDPAVLEGLRAAAWPLATVEAGHGFADLAPLKAWVGDARIVALGEATHGTREFFQAKHRLLEYLVAECGFTQFAMEANWPESLAVNDYVLHGTGDAKRALAGLYFWTWNTEEVLALIEWMRAWNADPAHATKVQFAGVDMQVITVAARATLDYLQKAAPSLAEQQEARLTRLANLRTSSPQHGQPGSKSHAQGIEEQAALDALVAAFDEEMDAWLLESSEEEWAIARQQAVVMAQAHRAGLPNDEGLSGFEWRDRCMAENLRWLLRQGGPEARVVVWAHDGHVSRGMAVGTQRWRNMGWHLARAAEQHPDERLTMKVAGFSFATGAFQAMGGSGGGASEWRIDAPLAGSIDAAFAAAGLSRHFVDLHASPAGSAARAWLDEPRVKRGIGSVWSPEAAARNEDVAYDRWPDAFDALLFIDGTTRARPVR
ncbi:MAG: erythromycin esterase family protein [Planctomycetes bacterium]|nr:erythromycin esterase family protein [Planctomycetota bacterium]